MIYSPWWIVLGIAIMILVFVLIERCVKYSRSLPEEDIAPLTDSYHGRTSQMNDAAIERNRCPLTDEEVHALGEYFDYHKFYDRLGITFENFVQRVRNDTWQLMF